ncbi:MAG: family 43 glycosylhydrolase [Flavobacterium sp.]|nr:family 43 glycosylhydrolase [Flavobacterium sp.]
MKNKQFLLGLLITLTLLFANEGNAQGKSKNTYNNPVITGFNPDPSICKVGNDYYLVTSTFEYFPGVPVYHSTDLVNWKMIGHVLDRPSQLNLDGCESSGGIFAPCIRYNKGVFYMVTTLIGKGGGDFICTATNPAGPWSEPHFIKGAPGIDPDLLFDDDGKVYMSGTFKPAEKVWPGQNTIWTQEVDLTKWELVGERHTNLDSGDFYSTVNPLKADNVNYLNAMEGPHIYKKDGTYYFTCSIGGTGQNHAFIILRSKNVFGPWEMNPANPILTHRDLPTTHPITATGHADLIQIQNGDWAIVHLGKRPMQDGKSNNAKIILGRETYVSMVDWSGEWPIVNPKGKIGRSELVQQKPNLPEMKVDKSHLKDDFNADKLHSQWNFLRTPRSEWWSLTDKKGYLRLQLRPEMINEKVNPSFICKRQEHSDFEVVAKMEFNPTTENEEAGIVIERDRNCYLKYTLSRVNNELVLKLAVRSGKATDDSEITQAKVKSGNIHLKISAIESTYSFSYSLDGKKWKSLDQDIDLVSSGLVSGGKFTGPLIGMYASSNGKQSQNVVYFDSFYYTEK